MSCENNSDTGAKKYENVIKQIRGVIAVRVVLDHEGDFEEIHVLAGTERNPKQLVRDIETVIMVAFGIVMDHKKISIVQMPEDNIMLSADNWRPRLVCIDTSISKVKISATVQLSVLERTVEGTASGPNSPLNRMRMVATATLAALERFSEGRVSLSVDEISKMNFHGSEIIIVSVFMVSPGNEDILLGAAYVNGNEGEAVGKATLSAVNRKLSAIMRQQQ